MWKKFVFGVVLLCGLTLLVAVPSRAEGMRYGERLCTKEGFHCVKIWSQIKKERIQKKNRTVVVRTIEYFVTNLKTREVQQFGAMPTWQALWPDERAREIVMKLNRMNVVLRPGMIIAVPDDMVGKTFMDYSPFPLRIESPQEKLVIWDPQELAWAAYAADGTLVRWGPGVGGMDYCADVKRSCRTIVGTFRVFRKEGPDFQSNKYPLGCRRPRCAPMPHFMQFHSAGYGLHASTDVPGHNASHGCIRLFLEDAKWLSLEFVDVSSKGTKGTKVIVKPYQKS
ncbi:MAG: L,D-transpeptidase [Parcubacteria group bacterium]|nr:L,D-transpeptidase [Parcubacteria group bacterium]